MKTPITIKQLTDDLKKYPLNTIVDWKLVPNTPEAEDDDRTDEDLDYIGEIYTGGLDSEEPYIEIGLKKMKT